jgi:hypothetical protein
VGVWYSYSTDGGRTWAAPARVDTDDHTDLWPWIAVGAPGRVAIAWFGNDNRLPDNDPEQAGPDDPWNVYVAQTLTGLGCASSTAPGFRVTKATPEPFHTGTVCTGGTICEAELIDRRLGDSVALPAFFRQVAGPSSTGGGRSAPAAEPRAPRASLTGLLTAGTAG